MFHSEEIKMAISNWLITERPREKLLNKGAEALSDAELLAIFLRTGLHGKSAVDLARESLQYFGGLRQLLDSDYQQLQQIKGMGSAKIALLYAALEIGKRYLEQDLRSQDFLNKPDACKRYLQIQLRSKKQEVFACLFLNTQLQFIHYQELFTGTIDHTTIYPRIIVERAIYHQAAAVIICHNHPSGNTQPSDADHQVTKKIKQALATVDIRLLDHIIVGEGKCYSFAENGFMFEAALT